MKEVAVDTWERRHLWEIGGGVPGKAPGAEERAPRGWGERVSHWDSAILVRY